MLNKRGIENSADLIRLVVGQAAAQVSVAPGKRLAPGGWNQNFVLLHSQDAFIGAHNLSHGLLQLCSKQTQK